MDYMEGNKMRELPQNINTQAALVHEAFNGVENIEVRAELRSLALCLNKNQVALGLLQLILDRTMNTVEAACYVYQHSNQNKVAALLMVDLASKLSDKDIDKLLSKLLYEGKQNGTNS